MEKTIFVSGSHRSGSTWVGDVITSAKGIRYIFEPFNVNIKRRNLPFTLWFTYIGTGSEHSEQQAAKHYINSFVYFFHSQTAKKIFQIKSLGEGYRHLVDSMRKLTDRTVIKDPIAIMSAEWIYLTYGWDMIILIRHPAAFIASIKVQDWQFPFADFRDQPALINAYLQKYSSSIDEYTIDRPGIIKQGILLWNIIHDTILQYKEKYSGKWYFAKHEDLSIDPVTEFEKMFSFIHLSFDAGVKKYLLESTTSKEDSKLKRNAIDNIKSWKKRLSIEEINEIKQGTKDVWQHFYTESDW